MFLALNLFALCREDGNSERLDGADRVHPEPVGVAPLFASDVANSTEKSTGETVSYKGLVQAEMILMFKTMWAFASSREVD